MHGHAAPAQGFHVAHQPKRARRRAGSARASRTQALRKPPECGASAAACGGPSTAQPKGFIAASIIARRQLAEPPCTGAGGCARTVSSPALAVACALPRACACAVQKRQHCRARRAQAAQVNGEPACHTWVKQVVDAVSVHTNRSVGRRRKRRNSLGGPACRRRACGPFAALPLRQRALPAAASSSARLSRHEPGAAARVRRGRRRRRLTRRPRGSLRAKWPMADSRRQRHTAFARHPLRLCAHLVRVSVPAAGGTCAQNQQRAAAHLRHT